MRRKIYIFF